MGLDGPAVEELLQGAGIEVVMLAPAAPLRPKKPDRLEEFEVLGNGLPCQSQPMVHEEGGTEFEQRLPVLSGQGVQDRPAGRGAERLIDVSHESIIGKPTLACQPGRSRWVVRRSESGGGDVASQGEA